MRDRLYIWLGAVPAGLLAFGLMLGGALVAFPSPVVGIGVTIAGVAGAIGLFMGLDRPCGRTRAVQLLLVLGGMVVMLMALSGPVLVTFVRSIIAKDDSWRSPPTHLLLTAVVLWFALGPLLVGALQILETRRGRPPNNSLERSHER